MTHPESVVRRFYNGLVIEVELYPRHEGGFYAWPYIEKTRPNGVSKRHFVLDGERFDTKDAALQAAISQGQRAIDQGFDPEQLV